MASSAGLRSMTVPDGAAGFPTLVMYPTNAAEMDLRLGPYNLRAVIDALQADHLLAPVLQRGAVAIIGHSLGGYTALALAGGRPTTLAQETPDGEPHPVDVVAAGRVAALVLLAPATPWFAADGALADVRVPILMLTAEHDTHTPAWHGEIVARGVPDATLLEHREIAGAGHFSFQTPFPPHMVDPAFEPSQDPKGFDRPQYHEALQRDVTSFLAQRSSAAAGS